MEEVDKGEAETGLSDNNDALGEAVKDEADEECLEDEMLWRPYNPQLDEVKRVWPSDKSKRAAARLARSVKSEISFLKNKLRNKFLQARRPSVLHGVRKGRGLTERRLVQSVVELRSNQRPTRPDWMNVPKEECTLSAGIVIDQSGSMSGSCRVAAAKGAIAIASPLDILGSPCLVVGPRNGGNGYGYQMWGDHGDDYYDVVKDENGQPVLDEYGNQQTKPLFHRDGGVIIDVFKDWDDRMTNVLDRFGRVQACGSTPLCDGIQYAMQELSLRPERFRVIFVITDGYPDQPDVVRRQIRVAAEAGVFVVGVGIDGAGYAVKRLFPIHVVVDKLPDLPNELLKVLDGIMFPKHGRRIALDGKFKKTS
jgi:hypothetical protein